MVDYKIFWVIYCTSAPPWKKNGIVMMEDTFETKEDADKFIEEYCDSKTYHSVCIEVYS